MDPLISVIVPVYKVEEYLNRCIESIVNQTYTNLEIILVDDGSPDRCPEMCDEWAKKDKRIKVIHKKNGGQASARNDGLALAGGDLVGFVDSDDFIAPSMYEAMYAVMKENECDVVECSRLDFVSDNEVELPKELGPVTVFSREETIRDFLAEKHLKRTVWNMLVKASIARKVQFDAGKTHEDILWPYRVFMLSDRIAYLDSRLYFYFQRPNSTMNKKYSEKRFDGLDALETRAALIKTDFPQFHHLATKAYLGACMYQYQYLSRQPESLENRKFQRVLHDRFCAGDQKVLFDGLGLKYKVWYTLFRMTPDFTVKLRNMLKIGL